MIWWRGHASQQFELVPSVHRGGKDRAREVGLQLRFVTKAHTRYTKCPENSKFAEWLFLMQHYGAPTRLLDWTESVLVAAYFACSERPSEAAHIWGLLPANLNENQCGDSNVPLPDHRDVRHLFNIYSEQAHSGDQVYAIYPLESDFRMMLQSAVYTVHTSAAPMESLKGKLDTLIRFDIPSHGKAVILRQLRAVGIRRSTLFPDLQNLAQDLRDDH
jgi:hypothetical protein